MLKNIEQISWFLTVFTLNVVFVYSRIFGVILQTFFLFPVCLNISFSGCWLLQSYEHFVLVFVFFFLFFRGRVYSGNKAWLWLCYKIVSQKGLRTGNIYSEIWNIFLHSCKYIWTSKVCPIWEKMGQNEENICLVRSL